MDHNLTYLIFFTSLKTNWLCKIYQKLPPYLFHKCVCVLKTTDNSAKILVDFGVLEFDESFIVYMQQLRVLFLDMYMAWCVLISSDTLHNDREVYIVAVLKPAIVICLNVECFFFILEDDS